MGLNRPWSRFKAALVAMVWGACILPAVAAEPERSIQLKVLSYNIHHGEGTDGKLDLERIARVIKEVKPDLVAVQEVDQSTERTNKVDQPAELARLTSMNVAFAGNIRLQGGAYGNAILSKHPIKSHENHALPCLDAGEQRGVLAAEVELPGVPQPLLMLATHLDHRRDDQERVASARQINELVAKCKAGPMILAGDLNDVLGSDTLDTFQSVWTCANSKPQATIPVERPTRQIDFILVRPAERWKVVELRVLDEAVASDHRPILAVLELLPTAAKD